MSASLTPAKVTSSSPTIASGPTTSTLSYAVRSMSPQPAEVKRSLTRSGSPKENGPVALLPGAGSGAGAR